MFKNRNFTFNSSIFKQNNLSNDGKDFFISIFNKRNPENFLKSEFIRNSFITLFLLLVTIITLTTAYFGYFNLNSNFVINDRWHITAGDFNDPISETNPPVNWANLSGIPTEIRVIRAVMDLSIVWNIFFYFYSIVIACNYIKRQAKWYYPAFLMIDIIPLFALLFLFINSCKNFDKFIIKYQFNKFFSTEDFLVRQFRIGSKKRTLLFIEWLIYLPLLPILFIPDSSPLNNWTSNFWFYTASFFTLQGNSFVFLFLTLSLFFPGWQIFRTNSFQIMTTTYITIVTSAWCLILFPNFIVTNTFPVTLYGKISTIWIHIVTPWTFIALSMLLMRKTYKIQCSNILKITSITAIYPLMYELYLAILPFNTGISVYSWVTNLNPNLAIFISHHDVNSVRTFGNPIYIFFFILQEMIFYIIACLLSIYSYKSVEFNKKRQNIF